MKQPGVLIIGTVLMIYILNDEINAVVIYKEAVNGVKFTNDSGVLSNDEEHSGDTYGNLQHDDYVNGNFLYLTDGALKTVNYETLVPEAIAGNVDVSGYREGTGTGAWFRNPKDFCQWNETHVVIADYGNYCLRFISRHTNSTSTLLGICKSSGSRVDGNFTEARFQPIDAVAKLSDSLLIVAEFQRSIPFRLIDFITKEVSTWILNGAADIGYIRQFQFLQQHNVLYFSYQSNHLGMINLSTNTTRILIDSDAYGHNDGPLDQSVFRQTYPFTFLNDDTILVGPTSPYYEFRVIDLITNTTVTVTQGSPIQSTYSLLFIPSDGIVLLGLSRNLGYLAVSGVGINTPTIEPSSSTDTSSPSPGLSDITETTTRTRSETATVEPSKPTMDMSGLSNITETTTRTQTETATVEPSKPAMDVSGYLAVSALAFCGVISILLALSVTYQLRVNGYCKRKESQAPQVYIESPADTRREQEHPDIYDEVDNGGEDNMSYEDPSKVNRNPTEPPRAPQYLNMSPMGMK